MLIGFIVTAAIVGAGVMVWKMWSADRTPPRQPNLPTEDKPIPARWLIGEEVGGPIETDLSRPGGLAVGPGGRIYVGGAAAKQVRVFDARGKKLTDFKTSDAPRALAVAADGLIYVALRDHVEVHDAAGKRRAAWQAPGKDALLTSIAAAKADVYVANVIQRWGQVLRYRRGDGKLLQTFDGLRKEDRKDAGFVVPSPYFDVAVGASGSLWVVNPGRLRVEAYRADCGPVLDADGKPVRWGGAGKGLADFCGCCNPVHIALLPDGGFVTAEKGLTRVKVYDKAMKFLGVLAGPKDFRTHDAAVRGQGAGGADVRGLEVAVDKAGRVYVLDPVARQVRIFQRKAAPTTAPKT